MLVWNDGQGTESTGEAVQVYDSGNASQPMRWTQTSSLEAAAADYASQVSNQSPRSASLRGFVDGQPVGQVVAFSIPGGQLESGGED